MNLFTVNITLEPSTPYLVHSDIYSCAQNPRIGLSDENLRL